MEKLKRFLKSLRTSSRGETNVPGVADAIKNTSLRQEQVQRKKEMETLLVLVQEGRLHEANAHQLEVLKLALELNKLIESKSSPAPTQAVLDTDALATALKSAVQDALSNLPAVSAAGGLTQDTARPQMKHTSLTEFTHTDGDVSVSHGDTLGEAKTSEDSATAKLEKLRKLKGNG